MPIRNWAGFKIGERFFFTFNLEVMIGFCLSVCNRFVSGGFDVDANMGEKAG